MALTKQKEEVIEEVTELLKASKMTVIAKYQGTGVKALQQLRRDAADSGTLVRVIKNRLLLKAISNVEKLKSLEPNNLKGMLLYAFNDIDEVAAAQVMARFNKAENSLEFVGAISGDGLFLDAQSVTDLANLPSKLQLQSQVVGIFSTPLTGLLNVANGNSRNLISILANRAEAIS